MSSPDPKSIPLPSTDETQYANSSDSIQMSDHETRSTRSRSVSVKPTPSRATRSSTRLTRSSTRTPFKDIYNTIQDSPAPSNNHTPNKLDLEMEEDDEETPRPKPRPGRGKFVPGERPGPTPRRRAQSIESVEEEEEEEEGDEEAHEDEQERAEQVPEQDGEDDAESVHSVQRPVADGAESDGESEVEQEWEGKQEQGQEQVDSNEDSEASDDDVDMNRAVAVHFDTDLASLRGFPTSARSRRNTGRSSPGRTPAKSLLSHFDDFTPPKFAFPQETPRQTAFEDAFSATAQQTPYLYTASPVKRMSLVPIGHDIQPVDLEVELSIKDAEIRDLKEQLAAKAIEEETPVDEFIEFSPEKKMIDPPVSVRKRRSPIKNILGPNSTSPIGRTPSRTPSRGVSFKTSPIKGFNGLLEDFGILEPTVTQEEKKASKRRRQTQEFRDFSAIDFSKLKQLSVVAMEAQPMIVEEPEDEEMAPSAVKEERHDKMDVDKDVEPAAEEPKAENQEESTEPTAQPVQPVEVPAETEPVPPATPKTESKPTIALPPTPTLEQRTRSKRSGSCPPAPEPLVPLDPSSSKIASTNPIAFKEITDVISQLQAQVAELEDKLSTTSVQLEKTTAALHHERRARIAAEETRQFLELEKKFGACCENGHGAKPRKEEGKAGPAAVPLPGSPAQSVASMASTRRPPTRIGASTASRGGAVNRPESRLASERPASRLGGYTRSTAAATSATIAASRAGMKRAREEPSKSQHTAPPPAKRVLSGPNKSASNAIIGNRTGMKDEKTSALAKKPEKKIATIGRLAAARGAAGGASAGGTTATGRGLSRGARR